jgi:YVTN family beta-propeller protein
MRRSLNSALLGAVFAVLHSSAVEAAGTGLLFVSQEKGNQIAVLDPKTYAVLRQISTGRRPRDMHFNATKTRLYVACGDANRIEVIDVARLTVVDRIPTGESPEMFVLSPDEKTIYVSSEERSALEVIDVAS